jgi:uncharacterized protein
MPPRLDRGFGDVIDTPDGLAELYGPPSAAASRAAIDHLDRHCRDFIACSPFVLVATADRDGRCDVSPRGGPPGFVAVLDERRLLIADARGNRRISSIRNVVEAGHAGLLFLIPGLGETLRVNGRAVVVRDEALLSAHTIGGTTPRVALGVEVEEAFIHCAKALKRSGLWQPEQWPGREDLASPAEILRDHIAMPHLTTDRVQRFLDEDYERNLY